MITGKIAPADIEPINGRKVAAFAFAFAITLVLVTRQLKNDIRWLLIPIFVSGSTLLILYLYELRMDLLGEANKQSRKERHLKME